MDPRDLRVTKNVYFSLMTCTKKLLLVAFGDQAAETGVSFRTDGRTEVEGQTDVEVEMII